MGGGWLELRNLSRQEENRWIQIEDQTPVIESRARALMRKNSFGFCREKGQPRRMIHFFAKLLFGVCIFGFVTIPAAQGGDLAQEYDQVRKIALKDPKVRAAFDRANEKLNKRIIEIDPALKPFVEGQRGGKSRRNWPIYHAARYRVPRISLPKAKRSHPLPSATR